jgi:nucleotide-binding universal stress UspA family protein
MINISRILVPIDFSQEARFALDWAVQLLNKKSNASIFLYHVEPATPYLKPNVHWNVDGLDDDTGSRRYLESWLHKIPSHIHSDFLVGHDSITEDISYFCRRHFIDMIVMVAREHHGLSRWVRHNTCESIVRAASCPVLVLHHNQFQNEPVEAARSEACAMLTPAV